MEISGGSKQHVDTMTIELLLLLKKELQPWNRQVKKEVKEKGGVMLLNNLMKRLIDKMSFGDKKVYIELYSHDKEKDDLKIYKFDITDVDEGGELGFEEYTKIVGKLSFLKLILIT